MLPKYSITQLHAKSVTYIFLIMRESDCSIQTLKGGSSPKTPGIHGTSYSKFQQWMHYKSFDIMHLCLHNHKTEVKGKGTSVIRVRFQKLTLAFYAGSISQFNQDAWLIYSSTALALRIILKTLLTKKKKVK